MFKQLKFYYFFVSLPFVLLLVGASIFSDGIKGTITRNPHPQINFTIFAIILIGGILVLLNTRRLVREARTFIEFFGAVHAKKDVQVLHKLANSYTGESACLLQMVAASEGRSISHQEQVAIEHELTNTRSSLLRRNALPQYLTGLLVGMGLLGTFIGLLATLNDITILISSFADLDMQNASPLLVFRTMIERMKAPMQSMGIAFSASMFGLLGSIILGLMMVGLRRLQGDMFSVLSSEIARHIEIALSHESLPLSAASGRGASSDVSNVLLRIDERYAEAARTQQRALTSLIDDIQKQRVDLLRALTDQTEASNGYRSELAQLGRQLGGFFSAMEKRSGDVSAQISDLTVHLAADARESHKLLAMQVDEQKRFREALDSFQIEERLSEVTRLQQRALAGVMDDMQQQRAEIQHALTEQTASNNRSHGELRQIGGQLESLSRIIENGNTEHANQLSELTVHASAEARQSHHLLDLVRTDLQTGFEQVGGHFEVSRDQMETGQHQICSKITELMGQASAEASGISAGIADLGGQMRTDFQQLFSQITTGSRLAEKGQEAVCTRISELTNHLTDSVRSSHEQIDHMSNRLHTDLQQLDNQLVAGSRLMEKGNEGLAAQISRLVDLVGEGAKISHGQLTNLGDLLRDDLRQLDRQLDTGCQLLQKGSDEISVRLSELIASVARASDESPEQEVATEDDKMV